MTCRLIACSCAAAREEVERCGAEFCDFNVGAAELLLSFGAALDLLTGCRELDELELELELDELELKLLEPAPPTADGAATVGNG